MAAKKKEQVKQTKQTTTKQESPTPAPTTPETVAEKAKVAKAHADELIDEIDGVLEENQKVLETYHQRGGE